MRKQYWFFLILTIICIGLLFHSVGKITASTDQLTLSSPSTCPSSGCAAGQRLNFGFNFSVSPNNTLNPNTQICIYTPISGQAGAAIGPWASKANMWISDTGLLSGLNFTEGQISSLCTNNTDAGDEWLIGAYASYASALSDKLEFAFNIDSSANVAGDVKAKLFQRDLNGNWTESLNLSQTIPVTGVLSKVYVGRTAADCGINSPCYINSGDDRVDGLGTGLRDAIMALKSDNTIYILNDYVVKDQTVLVDKNLKIYGYEDALLTNIGSGCTQPMLRFTQGGVLQDLTINDGNCSSPSRNLLEINSSLDIAIEHNTLNNGYQAITIKDNIGKVNIAFNQIANNQDYGIFRDTGTGGEVSIYANNFINNRSGYQVNCNNNGIADHNFWGDGVLATTSALNCVVSNGKQLGAKILLTPGKSGVEAIRQRVTSTTTYAFNNKIGARHNSGEDFNVIIVNHGQGEESNIPFSDAEGEKINPCSNFYDVFLEEGSAASDLVLTLKYDLNAGCISAIESTSYCAQSDSSKYPLWWYDPANDVTDGWDRTGQNPEGPGGVGTTGQQTSCDMNNNTISVIIDNTGKPGLSSDLFYTPFAAGLSIPEGVQVSSFTVTFNITKNDLNWITTSENNVKGFHVLRSDVEGGPYTRISSLIQAIGGPSIGGIYNYTDSAITYAKTYFYKIEVINQQDESIQLIGPVSVLTSTATPTPTQTRTLYPTRTATLTRTPYPTRTATPYFYRSPTSYYRPATSTPRTYPTQVRTYGPSPTSVFGASTQTENSPIEATTTYLPGTSYPIEPPQVGTEGYPINETEDALARTLTPAIISDGDTGRPTKDLLPTTTPRYETPDDDQPNRPGIIQWEFLAGGILSGLFIIGITSLILSKFQYL